MDVGQIATGLALSNTASTVTMSVMKDAQSLEQDLVSRLFGSIGIGNGVDAFG